MLFFLTSPFSCLPSSAWSRTPLHTSRCWSESLQWSVNGFSSQYSDLFFKVKRAAHDVTDRKHSLFRSGCCAASSGVLWCPPTACPESSLWPEEHIGDLHHQDQALTSPTEHFKHDASGQAVWPPRPLVDHHTHITTKTTTPLLCNTTYVQ